MASSRAAEGRIVPDTDLVDAEAAWRQRYAAASGGEAPVRNRSGIEIKPLYTPADWDGSRYADDLGYPGEPPYTRGVYATMHRGRAWSQRQIVGLGVPEDYNRRQRLLIDSGVTGVFVAPCNSHMRGYDADQSDPAVLGTCGTVINTIEDMALCLEGIPLDGVSMSLGDTSPFTLAAMVLTLARQRNVPWQALSGTTNQSDYLSHWVANHMFLRLSLAGSRRLLADHIAFMSRHAPRWNPLSVVGQHMQQAGATPAQAMAFTLASAIQYAEDCMAGGQDPDAFLPRFSFFFDISISFFEEVAKFRAGRRLWAKITRERLGARDPRSWRFRFHAQTSGVDLTRRQPLNNVTRAAVQAMAGIFGGLQSLHVDAYDEALSSPSEAAARISVATQNILREEAHLADVIDPLGGSYYVERLTDQMQAEIESVLAEIDAAGGMYRAVEQGLVQKRIGDTALAFQESVDDGRQTVVGVNAYRIENEPPLPPPARPAPAMIERYLVRLRAFKSARDNAAVRRALDALARAADDPKANVYEQVVGAIAAGATNGEVCARLRDGVGFGQPLVMA